MFLFTPHFALKTNQTIGTALFFIHLMSSEGPPNHPVSIKPEHVVIVNKHGSYQSKSKMILL